MVTRIIELLHKTSKLNPIIIPFILSFEKTYIPPFILIIINNNIQV